MIKQKEIKGVELISPKAYHIVIDKNAPLQSVIAVLNECDLVFCNKEKADEFKKKKVKGIKVIYK